MVARRHAHRVRDDDGESVVLLCERPHEDVPASSGPNIDVLSKAFDEDPILLDWGGRHLLLRRRAHVLAPLSHGPRDESVFETDEGCRWEIPGAFTFTSDFRRTAFLTSAADTFPEIATADVATMSPRPLTDLGAQLKDWTLGASK